MMLSRRANAKINLGLRILKRLPDGYHAIETIFVELDWGDTLFAEPSKGIEIICRGIPVPAGEDNLIVRAARRLQPEANVSRGARITLEKSIPPGGGLGGGSSDAAATLKLLSQLWSIDVGEKELIAMARSLGADVPFFLQGGTAYATGTGDLLQPVTWAFDGWIVLFCPGWEVSTQWAYQQWDKSKCCQVSPPDSPPVQESPCGQASPPDSHAASEQTSAPCCQVSPPDSDRLPLSDFLDLAPGDPRFRQHVTNDFEPIVFRQYPALKHRCNQFWETCADYVGLSGSGSCLYGLYSDFERAAAGLEWAQSQGWACLTRRR